MKTKITILQDFYATVEGQLNPVKLGAGLVLHSSKIVNNGTPHLAYECVYSGWVIYVKPLIGYVQTELV